MRTAKLHLVSRRVQPLAGLLFLLLSPPGVSATNPQATIAVPARTPRPTIPIRLEGRSAGVSENIVLNVPNDRKVNVLFVKEVLPEDEPKKITVHLGSFRDEEGGRIGIEPAQPLQLDVGQTMNELPLEISDGAPGHAYTGAIVVTADGFVPKTWRIELRVPANPTPTPTPAPSVYDKVKALRDVGMVGEAWGELKEIKNSPGALSEKQKAQVRCWFLRERAADFWGRYWKGLSAILVLILCTVGWCWRRRHQPPLLLDIGKFEIRSSMDSSGDSAIGSAIEEFFARVGHANPMYEPGIIHGAVENRVLPAELTQVPPEVSGVINILGSYLFPVNVLQLSGVLQHDPLRGAGLSLRLTDQATKRVARSTTIWQSDVTPFRTTDPSNLSLSDFMMLTEAAAIWAYWEVQHPSIPASKARNDRDSRKIHAELRPAFGTWNWRSYMSFCASLRMKEADQPAAEEELLRKALINDLDNRHALTNLGSLYFSRCLKDPRDAVSEKHARETLERVIILSDSLIGPKGCDPARILAHFRLGLLDLNKFMDTGRCDGKLLEKAKRSLRSAYEEARGMRGEGSTNEEATNLVVTAALQASLGVTYAGALLYDTNENVVKEGVGIVERIDDQRHIEASVQFNLACYYSESAALKLFESREAAFLAKSLDRLSEALLVRPSMSARAWIDPALATLRDVCKDEFVKLVGPKP